MKVQRGDVSGKLLTAGSVPCLLLLALAGCAAVPQSEDYQRHRDSQLVMPLTGGDEFFFDARVTPQLPADDPVAEAQRMAWLESWLRMRRLCSAGYEIVARRAFRFEESNPGRFDLRYVLRCKSPPAGEDAGS